MISEEGYQQAIFQRLSRVQHSNPPRAIGEGLPIRIHREQRMKEVRDQFSMVDQNSRNRLSREQLVGYLQQKYQVLNHGLIDSLLDRMEWPDGEVSIEEFCNLYIRRELQLASSINRKRLLPELNELNLETLQQFGQERRYAMFSINRVELNDRRANRNQQSLSLLFDEAPNMAEPLRLTVKNYDPAEESLQLLVPAQHDGRFIIQLHIESQTDQAPVARALLDIASAQLRNNEQTLFREQLTLYNLKVGEIVVALQLLPKVAVEQRLLANEQSETAVVQECEREQLELEYLQFLWGGLPSAAHKVSRHNVGFVSVMRWLFIGLLIVGAAANHLGGRFDPLTFLLAFSLLTLVRKVWLKIDLVQFLCLDALSLFTDVGWIALSQFQHTSLPITNHPYLNKLALSSTILFLPIKLLFAMYIIIQERPN